jgi:hypothetical protein
MLLQHLGNRAARNAMIQVLQCALDPSIASARIFLGHPDNQLADLLHHAGTTKPLPKIRPLCGD